MTKKNRRPNVATEASAEAVAEVPQRPTLAPELVRANLAFLDRVSMNRNERQAFDALEASLFAMAQFDQANTGEKQ